MEMTVAPSPAAREQVDAPATTVIVCPAMGPAGEIPGAGVLQKAAIVVRSKSPSKNLEGFSQAETEGTYDNIRLLDAIPQRISSIFPSPTAHHVISLPYGTEALLSEVTIQRR